eukprot:TRINITY_DN9932_c0_g1_i1.p1 TRINITY_DN9932_c0_g1~~TRINITY_DN9932_c0_g1_i1.p1  ORF type:complete len:553 (+),score=114.16 TRINITY_DN9932_c0_g1_i1:140-1798(+)
MDNAFKDRLGRIFGSLLGDEQGSAAWQVSETEVERRTWRRTEPDSSREETPCASSFSSAFLSERSADRDPSEPLLENTGEESEGSRGGRLRFGWEQDDDAEADGRRMRSVVGLDSTLDREDEEDEYDKVAVGRENASERTYMSDVLSAGSKINPHNVIPGSLDELKNAGRDPRANHFAAQARLREDDDEAATHFDKDKEPSSVMEMISNKGSVMKNNEDNADDVKDESGDAIMQEAQMGTEADEMKSDMELKSIMRLNLGEESSKSISETCGQDSACDVIQMKHMADDLQMHEAESATNSEGCKPQVKLRSIMKGKKRQGNPNLRSECQPSQIKSVGISNEGDQVITSSSQGSKKKVRFELGVKGDESSHDVTSTENSEVRTTLSGGSSIESSQSMSNNIPDYVRNPSKYTHYTLDWSNEEDFDTTNMQALKDFTQLGKKQPEESADTERALELPKSVTFIPRKKAENSEKKRENVDSSCEYRDNESIEKAYKSNSQPIGIAARQTMECDTLESVTSKIEPEHSGIEDRVSKAQRGSRKYRSKSKSGENDSD